MSREDKYSINRQAVTRTKSFYTALNFSYWLFLILPPPLGKPLAVLGVFLSDLDE